VEIVFVVLADSFHKRLARQIQKYSKGNYFSSK